MSEALYNSGGLRFWTEDEIQLREQFTQRIISVVKRTLLDVNPAWSFAQMEGPILTPLEFISCDYTDHDVFSTNHRWGPHFWRLRPETTASSYVYAKSLHKKLPLCVYQYGKSFRREINDGASAAKLRFNEFWQLEFQCIYSTSTKANYRGPLLGVINKEISRFTMLYTRVVPSERLPSYSENTLDIEVNHKERWREVASCSIRNDYSEDTKVCEIAIGLDRVATLASGYEWINPLVSIYEENK